MIQPVEVILSAKRCLFCIYYIIRDADTFSRRTNISPFQWKRDSTHRGREDVWWNWQTFVLVDVLYMRLGHRFLGNLLAFAVLLCLRFVDVLSNAPEDPSIAGIGSPTIRFQTTIQFMFFLWNEVRWRSKKWGKVAFCGQRFTFSTHSLPNGRRYVPHGRLWWAA